MPGMSGGIIMSCWRVRKANEAISHSSAASMRWNRRRAGRGIGPSLPRLPEDKTGGAVHNAGVTSSPEPGSPEDRLAVLTAQLMAQLTAQPPYWMALAMQEQGSRFFQHLGAALAAADPANRRRILQTWPDECWDFYQRGLVLEQSAGDA